MLTSWAVGIFVSGLVLRNGLGAEEFRLVDHVLVHAAGVRLLPGHDVAGVVQPGPGRCRRPTCSRHARAADRSHVFRADLMLEALALNAVSHGLGVFGFLKLLQARSAARLPDADRE